MGNLVFDRIPAVFIINISGNYMDFVSVQAIKNQFLNREDGFFLKFKVYQNLY